MKKIVFCIIVMLMSVSVCNAKGYSGKSGLYGSGSHKTCSSSGRNCQVEACRVSSLRNPMYYNMAGVYIQARTGYLFHPTECFDWSVSLGIKTYIGLVAGVYISNQVADFKDWGGGIFLQYEFANLRRYTKLVYPVVGLDLGILGNIRETGSESHPKAGYKLGLNCVVIRDRLDLGIEYSSNYHFVGDPIARYTNGSFLDHSVSFVTRVFIY